MKEDISPLSPSALDEVQHLIAAQFVQHGLFVQLCSVLEEGKTVRRWRASRGSTQNPRKNV